MRPLLEHISKELRSTIKSIGMLRSFGTGELIFAESESADWLPIVVSGQVKMIHSFENGKDVIIGIFGKGEMFAVPPVFDGSPYPASAYAIEPSKMILLRRDRFLQLLRESNEFAFAVIGWMCERLRDKTAMIQTLADASPEHRIANVLVKLTGRREDRFPVKIALRRKDIAEMAGLTTETTIRVIRKMAGNGAIRIEKGKIVIDSLEKLR